MRIGLIGAGALGAAQAVNLVAVPDCRLRAVASQQVSPAALKVIRSTGRARRGTVVDITEQENTPV
jgi:predicted homoserine dehydrogenase-like protein